MPSPTDLIYSHVFKELINNDFTERESETAAARAVEFHRKNVKHKDAIKRAISEAKKIRGKKK